MQEFYDVGPMSAQEIKNAFVKCFASRDGRIVLSFLRKMTQANAPYRRAEIFVRIYLLAM